MDRISKNVVLHRTTVGVVKYGEKDSVPIDQQSVMEFNIDPSTGRPISDITVILRSNRLDQQRLMSELTQFESKFLPDDISDVDALKYMKPRLVQLPSELAEHVSYVMEQRLQAEQAKKNADELDLFKKSLLGSDDDDKDKELKS